MRVKPMYVLVTFSLPSEGYRTLGYRSESRRRQCLLLLLPFPTLKKTGQASSYLLDNLMIPTLPCFLLSSFPIQYLNVPVRAKI